MRVQDIDVSPDLIRQGADHAVRVSRAVATAHGAVRQALPEDAFGLMCTPLFKPAYDMITWVADEVISAASQREEKIAESLRLMADRIEETDEMVARGFARLEERL